MKKLIALIGAAVMSFGLFADTPAFTENTTYTVPSEFKVGPTNIVGFTDTVPQSSIFAANYSDPNVKVQWFAENFPTGDEQLVEFEQPVEVANGDVLDETGVNYLKVEADTAYPMLRTLGKVTRTVGDDGKVTYGKPAYDIGDLGIFIDTKVQLSASEEPPQDFNGKIAVWLHVVPEEKDENGEVVTAGCTNLMVTCGQLDDDYNVANQPTNIAITAEGVAVKPDTWYQVTIRSIKTIAKNKTISGFVIFINGKLATVAEGASYVILGTGLEPKAKEFNDQHALFASAVGTGDDAQTLESVGMAGNGGLRYIDLTDAYNAPMFAVDPTTVLIKWDENVDSITIGDEDITTGVEGYQVAYVVTNFNKTIEAEVAYKTGTPGYRGKSITGEGFADSKFTAEEDKTGFTFEVDQFRPNTVVTVVSELARDGAQLYVKNGEGQFIAKGAPTPYVKDMYDYIAGLIASGELRGAEYDEETLVYEGDTIKIVLTEDETANDFGDWSKLALNIILDLNGHYLAAGDAWAGALDDVWGCVMINNTWNMTITDGSFAGGGSIIGTEGVDPIVNQWKMTIEAVAGDPIEFVSNFYVSAGSMTTLLDGKYTEKPTGQEAEEATITLGTVQHPLEWSEEQDAEGFWTLQPVQARITVVDNEGVTYSFTTNGQAATSPAKIEYGMTAQVVATLKAGYQFTSTSVAGWAFADGKATYDVAAITDAAKSITITIPATENIPVELTLTAGDKTTLTADPAAPYVYGDEIKVTAAPSEDYEFANASYEGWVKEGKNLVSNFVIKADTSITGPAATAIDYAAWVTIGGNTQKFTNYDDVLAAIAAAEAAGTYPINVTIKRATENYPVGTVIEITAAGKVITGDGVNLSDVDIAAGKTVEVSGSQFTYSGTVAGTLRASDITIPAKGAIKIVDNGAVVVGIGSELDVRDFTVEDHFKVVVYATTETKTFKVKPIYDITITAPTNGTLETSVTNGILAGESVTVTVTPAEHYQIATVTTNGYELAAVNDVYTFNMPAENVTLAATFTEIMVTNVTLDVASTNVVEDESFTLAVTVLPVDALRGDITWSSSDDAIATVANGTVTAVAEGTATITATNAASGKFATCTVTVAASVIPWDGAGTAESPWELNSAQAFKDLKTWTEDARKTARIAGKYFKVTGDDITLTDWAGIGTSAMMFTGVLDGNGKTINVQFSSGEYQGLVGYAHDATIKDLTVNVTGFSSIGGSTGAAAFLGQGYNMTLVNLTATCDADAMGTVATPLTHNSAGIFVKLYDGAGANVDTVNTITACTNKMNIVANYTKVGGIGAFVETVQIGTGNAYITYTDCSNEGNLNNVYSTAPACAGVGGIQGWSGQYREKYTLVNCRNIGTFTATAVPRGNVFGYAHHGVETVTGTFVGVDGLKAFGSSDNNQDFFRMATPDTPSAGLVTFAAVSSTVAEPTTYKVILANSLGFTLTDPAASLTIVTNFAAYSGTVALDSSLAVGYNLVVGGDETKVVYTPALKTYTVTFDPANGGETIVSNDVPHFTEFANVAPKDLAKTGYTFAGWDPEGAMVTGDAEYTAQWETISYPITYEYVNATAPAESNKESYVITETGTPITLTRPTVGAGYAFQSWTSDQGANVAFDNENNTMTIKEGFLGAIKVTATATKIPYAITYDYGTGTGPATSNQETYVISTEAQTIHLTAPTPALGYDFTGFALNETRDGVTFNDKTNMVIAAGQIDPISVQANYQVITYTIGYAMDGGTAPQGSPTSYTVNDSINVGDGATKDGHNFMGWTWEGQSTPVKNVSIPAGRVGNITFTAHWEIREFVQEFIKNIDAEVSNLPAKTNVAWHTKMIKPATDPSCVGYRFGGWYKDEHCTEEFDFNQSIEAAHFIYAKWVKTFTVKFTAGTGIDAIKVDGTEYTAPLTVDTNTVVNVTATVLEGYNEFTPASYTIVCDTNVTLATTLKVYEVTFADGANSKITPAAGTSNIVHGTQVTVTATADENYEFAAESYAGWTKQSNSTLTTNVTVTAAATFTAPAATATPVEITVPAADKLPAGVAELKIYQSSDNGATWTLVENGKIVVGNKWKVEGTAADGYTVKNPIASGTADLGTPISVTEAQVKSAVAYTVTVPELEHFTVAVTNGETEVGTTNGVYTFNYASNVKVAFAAADGYQITADTSTNIVSLVDNVVITAPTVEIKKYTITFMSDDAEYAVSNNVPHFTPFANVKPADPEKTGYTFAGWDPEGAMVTGDATYTAKWTINKFTVTFVQGLNKETTNTVADVEYGSKVAAENIPAITAIAGYTAAWDEDPTNTAITAAKTFTAQYTYIEYALTLTGGAYVTTNVSPANATYHYGDTVTVTATPNEFYTFAGVTLGEGWGLNESGAATNKVTIAGDTTVTIPSAVAAPVAISVPTELPTGVAGLTIYQSADNGGTWTEVTDGRIVVGNQWKVEGTAATGYTVQNPVANGTAELGKSISVSKEDVEAKVTINTYTVTVPQLEHFTVAVTNGETEAGTTNGVYTFNYDSNVKVVFAAETGYQITADTSTNIVSLVENVVITAPTVEKIKFNITFTDAAAWTNVVVTEYGEVPVAPEAPAVTGKSFKEWNPAIVEALEEATYTAVYTNNQFTLTIPAVDHASAVVSNATDEVSERVFDYGTQVTVYWTAEAGWKITSGATEAIEMTEDKTAATPVVEKAEITITVKKGTGIASVSVGGKELEFNADNEAIFAVPADAPTATLILEANDLKIPVYKMSIGKGSVGGSVTNKTPVITADAENVSKNYFTFTAEEAEVKDPTVSEDQKKDAIIDAMGGNEDAVEKVNNIVTTETTPAEGKVTATELATWITEKTISSADLAASDYVVASVKLGTQVAITDETEIKVDTVEKTSDLAVTVKVGDENATKEQIESYVELSGDLGADDSWKKLPQSTLKSAVTITDGKLVITPKAGVDKLFLKVVIPKDPGAAK